MFVIFLLLFSSWAIAMDDAHDDPFTPERFNAWMRHRTTATQSSTNQVTAETSTQNDPRQQNEENHNAHVERFAENSRQFFTIQRTSRVETNNDTRTSNTTASSRPKRKPKRKKSDDDDDSSFHLSSDETNSSTSSPLAPEQQTSQTLVIANPAVVTVAVPCIILDCDWCLRFDHTLRGDAAARQRLQLAHGLLDHCLRMHLSSDQLFAHIDWALTGSENPVM